MSVYIVSHSHLKEVDSDLEHSCQNVFKIEPSKRCDWVLNTTACDDHSVLLSYNAFLFCNFDASTLYIGVLLLACILAVLFIILATTADEFFCKAIDLVAKVLHLSEHIAAVTILAFGNGSADIFTSLAGALSGHSELVFAELLGSGVLITTVLAGIICLMNSIYLFGRSFIRDSTFYILAIAWIICAFRKKFASTWETSGFLILYVLYFLVVLTDRAVRKSVSSKGSIMTPEQRKQMEEFDSSGGSLFWDEDDSQDNASAASDLGKKNVVKEFFRGLNPIEKHRWNDSGCIGKLFIILQSPVFVTMKLIIPLVDDDDENLGWVKPLYALNCITLPVYGSYVSGIGRLKLSFGIPVILPVTIIASALSAIVYFTSEIEKPPTYFSVFAFLGFFGSVATIYLVASEIVSLLRAVGLVCHISEGTLGMTVLAWGNCLGDVISTLSIVRAGFPRMGLASCFGGPVFNTLMGIGIGFTIQSENSGVHLAQASFDDKGILCMIFLLVSLVSSLIFFPLMHFRTKPGYGIYLLSLYGVFLVICILNEVEILRIPGTGKPEE